MESHVGLWSQRLHDESSTSSRAIPFYQLSSKSLFEATPDFMSQLTKESKDPAINVTTWFLLVTAVLSVIFRLGTKYHIFRKLTSDDYLIIASLVFCIGQSITISIAVTNGYGEHLSTISAIHLQGIMKAQYSASFLYTMSLYFSKISISAFIRNLTPVDKDHLLATILQILITVWMVVAVLGTAFQCKVPNPWDYIEGKCIQLVGWHYFLSATNIATDLLLITQALFLIFRIQASLQKKAVFASIFMTRIFVIAAIIADIILTHDTAQSHDQTFNDFKVTITMQTIQCTSIVTACWGQLKPFLNQFKSNGLRIQGVEYESSFKTQYSRYIYDTSTMGSKRGHHPLVPIPLDQGNTTTVSALPSWDAGSQSSQAHIVIRETRSWVVTGARSSGSS
ncbi:hypothetical protein AOCH_001866 [Aspergillus ochraceoroseus]|uniref:Rhodopsin domain-containing protein n=2 Tax=Aspergillus ochraceoroseus TaxID=138278 RepID=A0A0F8WWQ8_9EURO|nr:hypothetical protein AOCH_001866 [Aspergillus ochraceoroseus]